MIALFTALAVFFLPVAVGAAPLEKIGGVETCLPTSEYNEALPQHGFGLVAAGEIPNRPHFIQIWSNPVKPEWVILSQDPRDGTSCIVVMGRELRLVN